MTNLTQQVKQGAEHVLASLSQGWRELKDRAGGGLTRFQASDERGDGEPEGDLPSLDSWGLMAADVTEGKDRVVVRLEAPGMSRADFKIELHGHTLSIQGDKRIEREFRGDGHHTIQSAYGSFRRDVPLPAAVDADKAKATYREGVIRVVLPKTDRTPPRRFAVPVN
jgi:HSP20 family protein